MQELAESEEQLKKVAGEENPADLSTKHLTRSRMDKLLELTGLCDREGRAESGLEVNMVVDSSGVAYGCVAVAYAK